eukprot:CAMPEP_0201532394 /NCGR_PEP_ID=MMETSP0161_2-20130828/50262_1 /ASSEMBLY_ACC=CAM_ASM_000251 /TAXON_ID=180227 /ORGANISM="Neoparamoeba aestuarina, Strain SoJaBio B1-5/56/2" /LENGTH=191 /DNA_ID=CAMNT_0047935787 /DNA_START=38 /DNA_END=609 /DNA_ORIENTATION=-
MGFLRYVAQSTPRSLPFKAHYYGKMYRCETPQFGRSREFWQFGVECIDTTPASSSPSAIHDVECILLGHSIMSTLFPNQEYFKNSNNKGTWKLHLNTLGNSSDLARFSEALELFFEDKVGLLSPDSQKRVHRKNFLRILDSKDPQDQELMNDPSFPSPKNYLSNASLERFEGIKQTLDSVGVNYVEDERLV